MDNALAILLMAHREASFCLDERNNIFTLSASILHAMTQRSRQMAFFFILSHLFH